MASGRVLRGLTPPVRRQRRTQRNDRPPVATVRIGHPEPPSTRGVSEHERPGTELGLPAARPQTWALARAGAHGRFGLRNRSLLTEVLFDEPIPAIDLFRRVGVNGLSNLKHGPVKPVRGTGRTHPSLQIERRHWTLRNKKTALGATARRLRRSGVCNCTTARPHDRTTAPMTASRGTRLAHWLNASSNRAHYRPS